MYNENENLNKKFTKMENLFINTIKDDLIGHIEKIKVDNMINSIK